jgi:hypothetical protein
MRRGIGVICECGDHAFAPLTAGFVTIVSPEDVGLLARKWRALRNGRDAIYAATRRMEDGSYLLHRIVSGAKSGELADHANGKSLDNRRQNLRVCDWYQNAWNQAPKRNKKSGLPKGVKHKGKRFSAEIKCRGKLTMLGCYDTQEQAHEAYAQAAKKMFGDFARLS